MARRRATNAARHAPITVPRGIWLLDVDDGVELEDASEVEVENAAEEEAVDTSGTPVCGEELPTAAVSWARTDAVGVGLLTTTEPEKGRSRLLVFCRLCSSLAVMLVRERVYVERSTRWGNNDVGNVPTQRGPAPE